MTALCGGAYCLHVACFTAVLLIIDWVCSRDQQHPKPLGLSQLFLIAFCITLWQADGRCGRADFCRNALCCYNCDQECLGIRVFLCSTLRSSLVVQHAPMHFQNMWGTLLGIQSSRMAMIPVCCLTHPPVMSHLVVIWSVSRPGGQWAMRACISKCRVVVGVLGLVRPVLHSCIMWVVQKLGLVFLYV